MIRSRLAISNRAATPGGGLVRVVNAGAWG